MVLLKWVKTGGEKYYTSIILHQEQNTGKQKGEKSGGCVVTEQPLELQFELDNHWTVNNVVAAHTGNIEGTLRSHIRKKIPQPCQWLYETLLGHSGAMSFEHTHSDKANNDAAFMSYQSTKHKINYKFLTCKLHSRKLPNCNYNSHHPTPCLERCSLQYILYLICEAVISKHCCCSAHLSQYWALPDWLWVWRHQRHHCNTPKAQHLSPRLPSPLAL